MTDANGNGRSDADETADEDADSAGPSGDRGLGERGTGGQGTGERGVGQRGVGERGTGERGWEEQSWGERVTAAGRWVIDTFRGHAGVREMRNRRR